MSKPEVVAYGSWKSPIQAGEIARGTVGLGEVLTAGKWIYWNELRPAEDGRQVVVRRSPDGTVTDMTPAGFSARTRVHEYGGGGYLPYDHTVVFVNFADQKLYRYTGKGQPELIQQESEVRYADFVWDSRRSRLIGVREDHRGSGEAVNTIACIYPDEGGRSQLLVVGNDFYAAPRLSPDGSQLAWLTWNHPDMPWEAAELRVAPVKEDGTLGQSKRAAGGPDEGIAQPKWSPDGVLYFISDRSNWWNLYRWRNGKAEPLTRMEAEFSLPPWRFRTSTYDFAGARRIICTYAQNGLWQLAELDPATGRMKAIELPYNTITDLRVADGQAAFVAGSATRPTALVLLDLNTGKTEELKRTSDLELEAGYISAPEAIEFPTTGGHTAHGFFYLPTNQDYVGPPNELPPLLVTVHGGPTGATSAALRLGIQYYTSRGIAMLDVNYGGSTGYGRKYRQRLYGQWGIVDVDDCCNGARYLAGRGVVDGKRMAITGGSAGGYTTLSCLAFRDVFAAGASHFGVSDCELLAKETHKFESHYLDRLIAPYPEQRQLYIERSPIHHIEGLSCPVIFFQGLEDKIVLPNQARMMVEGLRRKGVPVAYLEFPGEQHGFRKAANIQRSLEAELYFLSRVLGFKLGEPVEPIEIENL